MVKQIHVRRVFVDYLRNKSTLAVNFLVKEVKSRA